MSVLVKIFGTGWQSTKRIVWVAATFCFSVALIASLFAWKTIDSAQSDDESPLRLAFSPDTLELFFNENKEEHIARAEYSYLQGEYCVARNDYAGAHTQYADAVNELIDYVGLDVGVSRVLILRAGAVEQQFKKYDLAEKYFQTALKQPLPKSLPKSFPVYAWNHIADCYEHHGQWGDAIRIRRMCVEQASKLDSPRKKLLVNSLISLGGTYGNFQNYSDALKYIDQAITLIEKQADSGEKLECKASAYAWRGYLNLAVNQYQKAVDDLNIAISQNMGSDWSYFYRGRALQILGRYDLALADYNKAVAINPSAALERYRRGQTLAALGKHTEAITDFSQAEKLGGKDEYVQDLDSNSKSRSQLITSSALAARKSEEIIKSK